MDLTSAAAQPASLSSDGVLTPAARRLRRCGEVWGDVGRCGEMWGEMGRCGEMGGDVDVGGDVGGDGEVWGDSVLRLAARSLGAGSGSGSGSG